MTTRPAARCAVCHDALGREVRACLTCRSIGHATCLVDLGRCPTLGCPRSGRGLLLVEAERAEGGFREPSEGLIVFIVVSSVVLLLAAVVTINIMGQARGPRVSRPSADFRSLSDAIELFRRDCGRLPDTLDELWLRPPGAGRWGPEPYLEDYPPKDPWGTEYVYLRLPDGYDLVSYGADCAQGGTDEATDLSARALPADE